MQFSGIGYIYHDMSPQWSHVLTPLTNLLSTTNYVWSTEQDIAFLQMISLVIKDTILIFPDPNRQFLIETDASDYQLGTVIKQHNDKLQRNMPITFYSQKLTPTQQNYTTIEKELVSIVEGFKEFHQMLLGSKLTFYMEHKNLTHHMMQFMTQCILHW